MRIEYGLPSFECYALELDEEHRLYCALSDEMCPLLEKKFSNKKVEGVCLIEREA